jgi:hypothetical protein
LNAYDIFVHTFNILLMIVNIIFSILTNYSLNKNSMSFHYDKKYFRNLFLFPVVTFICYLPGTFNFLFNLLLNQGFEQWYLPPIIHIILIQMHGFFYTLIIVYQVVRRKRELSSLEYRKLTLN